MKKYLTILLILSITACSSDSDNTTGYKKTNKQYDWHGVVVPTMKEPQVFGSYTAGCLDGGVALEEEGIGYHAVNMYNNRLFGHPDLIKVIKKLGKKIDEELNRKILISDLGHPRGGPPSIETSSHRSHQTGLDADIWFRTVPANYKVTKAIYPESVLNDKRDGLSDIGWQHYHPEILKDLASFKEVERILVNPYVKKAMCEKYGNAKWLNKIRPWWGHHKHFHIRLACPEGSSYCKKQSPVPKHTGCGAPLDWWFSEEANNMGKEKSHEKRKYPRLPKQCNKVFNWEE